MKKKILLSVMLSTLFTSTLQADNNPWLGLGKDNAQQAINTNDVVWSINYGDSIYVRNGEASDWRNVSGELSSIDVMDSGRVWGINNNGSIYTRAGIEGTWQHINGNLKQLGVANNGCVWGINSNGNIYTRRGLDGSWKSIDGNLKEISVSNSGRVWGLNANGNIYTRTSIGGAWTNIAGNLEHIKVANNGRVWGINVNGDVYTRVSLGGSWSYVGKGAGKIVLAGDNYSWVSYKGSNHVFKINIKNPNNKYTRKVAHFADEHDPHNRLISVDYKNMTLLNTISIAGKTNHHADILGMKSNANYMMMIPKASHFVTIRDIKNTKYVKKLNLPFRPRSGDAYNPTHNLVVLNSRDRPSAVLIDTTTLNIAGYAGFNIGCEQTNVLPPFHGLYKKNTINNLTCSTTDNGGDQISGHPIWISPKAFAILDRANRIIHIYSIYKRADGWGTTLEQTIKTDTSLHQIIPKSNRDDNTIFFGETEGNIAQGKIAGVYRWRLNASGKGLIQEKFTKLIANNNKGTAGHNLYITPDEKYIYAPAGQAYRPDVKNLKRGGIFILRASDLSFVKYLKAGYGAGHVSFSKSKNLALVTNHQDNYVTAINYKTHTRISHIPVVFKRENIFGLTQSHAPYVEPTGRYYYNFWTDGGVFFRIDLNSLKMDKAFYVGGIPIQGNYYEDIATNFID